MNKALKGLAFAILGVCLGWCFGYIRFPYIPNFSSFTFGILLGLSFSLGLVYVFQATFKSGKSKILLNTWTLLIICIAVITSSIFYFKQQELRETLHNRDQEIKQVQSEFIRQQQQNNYVLVVDLLDDIKAELAGKKSRELDSSSIDKLAKLCTSLKPSTDYSLSNEGRFNTFSKEKGQLLLSLIDLKLDSSTFNHIKDRCSFDYAYLKEAQLEGLNLSGIKLNNSILQGANLRRTNLNDVDLNGTDIRYADFSNASMVKVKLQEADAKWSIMNHADLKFADLRNADFSSAELLECNLRNVKASNSKFVSSKLSQSDMSSGNFVRTSFLGGNLSEAKCIDCKLYSANLNNANLDGWVLNRSLLDKIKEEEIDGVDHILTYTVTVPQISDTLVQLISKDL